MNGPQMDIARVKSKYGEANLAGHHPSSRRGIKTVALLAACVNAGLNDGMIGPTLTDLQIIFGSQIEKVSIVFTWRALLAVAGALACSRLQERWSHPMVIAMALLLQGIAGAATPWVPDVLLMGVVSGIAAFFTGAVVTGVYCYTYHLWTHHSRPIIRGIRLFYTLGLAAAPLVVSAFLYQPPRSPDGKRLDIIIGDDIVTMSPMENSTNTTRWTPVPVETKVQYGYTIVGFLSVIMSVCFCALTNCRTCSADKEHPIQKASIIATSKASTKLLSNSTAGYSQRYSSITGTTTGTKGDLDFSKSSCHVLSVMLFFMLFTGFFGGLEVTFIGLLMSFNYNLLGWTKNTSLIMISVHQVCKAIFSLVFSLLSKYLKERTIMLFDMLLLVITTLFMFLTVNPETPGIVWACAVTLALTDSHLYRIVLSWLGSHMTNLESLPTLFTGSFSMGVMIIPYLTAHLMGCYGFLAYPGVLLTCSVICSVSCACLFFLVWCKYNRPEERQDITILFQSQAHV